MDKLRYLDEAYLPLVTKPSRYTGSFLHAARKDPSQAKARVLLCFPDLYEIGMSYLGLKILYHIVNRRPDGLAELCFTPWGDMERLMRAEGLPLYSLESRTPAREFDMIGFSLQYELSYTNVLTMIDLAQLSLRTKDRREEDPILIAGGLCTVNPEPLAPFIDGFVIGDGEEVIEELCDLMAERRENRMPRAEVLARMGALEGVYVPALYDEVKNPFGYVARNPRPEAPVAKPRFRYVASLLPEYYPERPLISPTEITHDRLGVEVMRGCTRGCRFCLAGYMNRPLREKRADEVVKEVQCGIVHAGWDEVSLLSLSTTDYKQLPVVLHELDRFTNEQGVSISLAVDPRRNARPLGGRQDRAGAAREHHLRAGSGHAADARRDQQGNRRGRARILGEARPRPGVGRHQVLLHDRSPHRNRRGRGRHRRHAPQVAGVGQGRQQADALQRRPVAPRAQAPHARSSGSSRTTWRRSAGRSTGSSWDSAA